MEKHEQINFLDYIDYIKSKIKIYLIIFVLISCGVFVFAIKKGSSKPVTYTGTTKILVNGTRISTGIAKTYDGLVHSDDFKKVIDKYAESNNISSEALSTAKVTTTADSSILTLTMTSSSEEGFMELNKAVIDYFLVVATNNGLTDNFKKATEADIYFSILNDTVITSTGSKNTSITIISIIAVLSGILGSALIAFFVFVLSDKVYSETRVENIPGLRIIGNSKNIGLAIAKLAQTEHKPTIITVMSNKNKSKITAKALSDYYESAKQKVTVVDSREYSKIGIKSASLSKSVVSGDFKKAIKGLENKVDIIIIAIDDAFENADSISIGRISDYNLITVCPNSKTSKLKQLTNELHDSGIAISGVIMD